LPHFAGGACSPKMTAGNTVKKLLLWLRRHKSRALFLVAAAYVVQYLRGVKRVKLHYGRDGSKKQEMQARLERITKRCPRLWSTYWPTFYAFSAFQQLQLVVLKEIRARLMWRPYSHREDMRLRDGELIRLDWAYPERELQGAPVCVLLHGTTQDGTSVTMVDLARSLANRGMTAVVLNRRGYGGHIAANESNETKLTLFGFDEDLDDLLDLLGTKKPGQPVAIIGFSVGSGFSARYVANRPHLSAWRKGSAADLRKPRVLCAVAWDPGYDVSPDGAAVRMPFFYSWGVNFALKYHYFFRHRKQLAQSEDTRSALKTALNPTIGLQTTMKELRKMSGWYKTVGDSNAWLCKQQPSLNTQDVPHMLVNSRDDPICVWSNVETAYENVMSNPNAVLVELARGSHGPKYDFWGYSSFVSDAVSEFILSTMQEFGERPGQ